MTNGQLVYVAGVALLGAMVQFLTGFGFSLTAVPLLAIVIDTRTASMLAAIVAMFTSSAQAWLGRASIDWTVVKRVCGTAMLGMPLGLWIFAEASEQALRLFLGISTLVLVGLLLRGVDLSEAGGSADRVAGFAAGILTTSINTNGPPIAFILQARKLPPAAFRATITTAFVVLGVVGLGGRLIVGGMTDKVWQGLAVAPPAMAVGGYIGYRLRPKVDGPIFVRAVQGLLILAGVSAIAAAIW